MKKLFIFTVWIAASCLVGITLGELIKLVHKGMVKYEEQHKELDFERSELDTKIFDKVESIKRIDTLLVLKSEGSVYSIKEYYQYSSIEPSIPPKSDFKGHWVEIDVKKGTIYLLGDDSVNFVTLRGPKKALIDLTTIVDLVTLDLDSLMTLKP